MKSVTITSNFEIMDKSEDRGGFRWLKYVWPHLDIHMFQPLSNLLIKIEIILLWLKRIVLCFEVHHRYELDVFRLYYFYSSRSFVMKNDLLVLRNSFAWFFFVIERIFRLVWAWIHIIFLSVIFGRLRLVMRVASNRCRRSVLIFIWLLLSVMGMELLLFDDCDFCMLLHQADDMFSDCKWLEKLLYHMLRKVSERSQISKLNVNLVIFSSNIYCLGHSLLDHLVKIGMSTS